MRVVDTSLWIELFSKGKLLKEAKSSIEPLDSCLVPTIVHYELSKWSRRVLSVADAKAVRSIVTECRMVDLDWAIASEAAILSVEFNLHTTDAIIYATAQMNDAKLYTCDAHFKGLPNVEYFEK
jgi:predicted nucleic acid-binding protein